MSFLSSVEIGRKSVPVGMEEKIIEFYALDQEKASLLKKKSIFVERILQSNRLIRCNMKLLLHLCYF